MSVNVAEHEAHPTNQPKKVERILFLSKPAQEWVDRNVARAKEIGVFCEVAKITPAIAEVMLAKNPNNRSIVISGIKEWCHALRSGDWETNGETIKISEDGELNDGQHRLKAVIETGITMTTFVVWGLPRESRETVDLVKKKTPGHILSMRKVGSADLIAAAVKRHINMRLGYSITSARPAKEIARELERFDDLKYNGIPIKAAGEYRQSRGLFLAIYWLIKRKHGTEKPDKFFQILFSPVGVSDEYNPAVVLGKRLQKNLREKAKLPETEVSALVIKSWNDFSAGKQTRALRWINTGDTPEKFPEIQ